MPPKNFLFVLMLPLLISLKEGNCQTQSKTPMEATPYLAVLGVVQDGGLPHAGCQKNCCLEAWRNPSEQRRVSCLAVVDPISSERWIIEATPDFKHQLRKMDKIAPVADSPGIAGILLTHGHIGHYAGLMHLGREVIGAKEVPVYVMPRMQDFLSRNGPWDQLLRLKNIILKPMQKEVSLTLNDRIQVTPFLVPHRDEYTETVGFRIEGPQRAVVFIPDIDKWEKWDRRLEEIIAGVDVAMWTALSIRKVKCPDATWPKFRIRSLWKPCNGWCRCRLRRKTKCASFTSITRIPLCKRKAGRHKRLRRLDFVWRPRASV
jgi:phosphoribosyl 1,2-cyclic phosphodiesterase